jgi:hypothetical protein
MLYNNARKKTRGRAMPIYSSSMNPEDLRKEVITMMQAVVAAEREACARIAADTIGGPTGKIIADRIRARPPFQLPPMHVR